jgi:hypothetical protein
MEKYENDGITRRMLDKIIVKGGNDDSQEGKAKF